MAALPGCSKAPSPWEGVGGPPRIVVSIPPLYSFVKQVGGDHVGVICLCTQTGPHSYEYNTKDAILLRQADLLLGIGLGLDEKFMDKLQSNSGNPKLKYVQLGEQPRLEKLLKKPLEDEHDADKKGHDEHAHGEWDPHVWLGIDTAKELVNAIADELKKVDAANAADYEKNAKAYCEKLDDLQAEYTKKLKGKKDRKILPMHESLQYFGDSFGLEIAGKIALQPGDTPTAERYKKLLDKCKKEKIRVIAIEPQFEAKAAEVLKEELGKASINAEVVLIDPLETADPPNELSADWYLHKMKKNLEALVDRLK
jgi:zinc transport system substrate-binding protein